MSTPTTVLFSRIEIVETYNQDNNKDKKQVDEEVLNWFTENLEHMGWQNVIKVQDGIKADFYN